MMGQLSQSTGFRGGTEVAPRHDVIYRRGDRREFICRFQRRHCRSGPGGAAGLSVCRAAGGDDYAYAGRNGRRHAGYWLPFPPTPTKPSAAGRGIPSAGCTGGSGYWLFRWKPISRRLFCIRGCRASLCGCSPWSSLSPSPAVTC